MTNYKIFLDLDGVLFNFEKRACELLDLDITDPNIRQHLKSSDPDDSIDKLIGKGKFWKTVNAAGEAFWENLDPFPWTYDFYSELRSLANGDLFILTSPPQVAWGSSGKVKAIQKHFKTRDYLIGPCKHACAGPNTLLIDDTPKKVNKFREYGGEAYLFPHAYSIIDGDITIEQVIDDIKCIIS